jgi:GAF domain-containing protein
MKKPDAVPNEARRLRALQHLNLLDTAPEDRFDHITRLAQRLFAVEIALFSLVDAERQWFKSRQGLAAVETSRDISFCGHVVAAEDLLVVSDTLCDERFHDNPLVLGDPAIRFYAGCPIHVADGSVIGTLCIIGRQPRQLNPDEVTLLRDLASMLEDELDVDRNDATLGPRG